MLKHILITFFLGVAILEAALPAVVLAGTQPPRAVPKGETTYDESYVPCGTKDTKKLNSSGQLQDYSNTIDVPLRDGTTQKRTYVGDGIVDNPCQFTDIIELAKRLIMGWIIAGVTFATMGFAYAGLLYITAMGSSEKISHAHSIFVKTFWGFVFMLSAWLIAYEMEKKFLTGKARQNSFLLEKKTP